MKRYTGEVEPRSNRLSSAEPTKASLVVLWVLGLKTKEDRKNIQEDETALKVKGQWLKGLRADHIPPDMAHAYWLHLRAHSITITQ